MRKIKAGFTLIEILVVIVIISIVSGITLMSIRVNEDHRMRTLANSLMNQFSLAETEALLHMKVLGFAFNETHYQFYEYHEPRSASDHPWLPLRDPALAGENLPSGLRLQLQSDEETSDNNKNDDNPNPVQIIISSSGDISPFVLLIGKSDEAARYQLSGLSNGRISVEKINAP